MNPGNNSNTWTRTFTQMQGNNLNNNCNYNNSNNYATTSSYFSNHHNRGNKKSHYFRGYRNFKAKGRGGNQQKQNVSNSAGKNSLNKNWRGKGRFHKGLVKDPVKYTLQELQEQQQQKEREELCSKFHEINELTELPGFDADAGQAFIYPTNKPVRDYQSNIVKTCLYNNTFVCLPTGLGKTFIAAVVMFNFNRWYPNDKIIFMAPTKPLVTQQLEACLNTAGIPSSITVELTGHTPPKKREQLWNDEEKKVFFLTPHILQNDIEKGICQATQIRCVVIDEAHKSTGKYASTVAIREIAKVNQQFRVLALSATPGSNFNAMKEVMNNLLISKLEVRSEDAPDVLPYVHHREVDAKVVPLGKGFFNAIYIRFQKIFEFYIKKLWAMKAIPRHYIPYSTNLTPNQVRQAWAEYRRSGKSWTKSYLRDHITFVYQICTKLVHARTRLLSHGCRAFYLLLHGWIHGNQKEDEKIVLELKKNTDLEKILSTIQKQLNILPSNSAFTLDDEDDDDESAEYGKSKIPIKPSNTDDYKEYIQSHPKMMLVRDIIQNHFNEMKSNNQSTRAMIFSEYRDSVEEIGCLLKSLQPLVKPMIFIGQASSKTTDPEYKKKGLNQQEQQVVLQSFKEGEFNVLVSTSVGEEGLDIGDVDLVICFDASKSPVKIIQRMGRTGRKRNGKIFLLLTEKYEDQIYKYSLRTQKANANIILNENGIRSCLYPTSPRMIPKGLNPTCYLMDLTPTNPCPLRNSEDTDYSDDDDFTVLDDEDDDDDFEPFSLQTQIQKSFKHNTKKTTSILSKSNSTLLSTTSLLDQSEISNDSMFQDDEENEFESTVTPSALLLGEKSRSMNMDIAIAIADFKKKKKDDIKMYCEIFDTTPSSFRKSILSLTSSSSSSHKPEIHWKEEFHKIPESELLIDSWDSLCIREKVDSCYVDDICLEAEDDNSIGFFDGSPDMDTSTSISYEDDMSIKSSIQSSNKTSHNSRDASKLLSKPYKSSDFASQYFQTPRTSLFCQPRNCQPKILFQSSPNEIIKNESKLKERPVNDDDIVKSNFNINFELDNLPDIKSKFEEMELFSDDEDIDYDAIPDFQE